MGDLFLRLGCRAGWPHEKAHHGKAEVGDKKTGLWPQTTGGIGDDPTDVAEYPDSEPGTATNCVQSGSDHAGCCQGPGGIDHAASSAMLERMAITSAAM